MFYQRVKTYNSLPPSLFKIRQYDRLKIFKRELKEYISDTIFLIILIDSIISLLRVAFLAFCIWFLYFTVILSFVPRIFHSIFRIWKYS